MNLGSNSLVREHMSASIKFINSLPPPNTLVPKDQSFYTMFVVTVCFGVVRGVLCVSELGHIFHAQLKNRGDY